MSDLGGDPDRVRYSLLNDKDLQCQDEDILQVDDLDSFRTTTSRTMGRSGSGNIFSGRLRGFQRITFLLILVAFFLIIIWMLSHMENSHLPEIKPLLKEPLLKSDGSKKSAELRTDLDSKTVYNWYQENCYKSKELGRSIAEIYQKLQVLEKSTDNECQLIWQIFDSMFRLEAVEAPISFPVPFQQEVKGWLGNDPKLYEQVQHQIVYKLSNKGTFEETVFNPIRSKRPQSKPLVDPLVYIQNLTESTQPACDFCHYKDHTAEDVFGRIDNEYSASCSNTFKLAKFHALFFPKQHSPLNLSLEQIQDLFLHTSKQWFAKAHETDPVLIYPSLMWDTLPHAGASQVHPHIHGVLDEHQYVGKFESWHQLSQQYHRKFKRSFWSDFVKLHFALGLGISSGNAMVLVPITARKDHEFMILSPDLNKDVTSLIYKVLQAYQNKLGVYCFSCGAVYPTMNLDADGDTGMPVIFRMGSRGSCSSIGSDVSSLELYTINNINSDLAKTYGGLVDQVS